MAQNDKLWHPAKKRGGIDADGIFDAVRQAQRRTKGPLGGGGGNATESRLRSIRRDSLNEAREDERRNLRRKFQAARAFNSRPNANPNASGGKPGEYTPGMLALRDFVTRKWGIDNVGGYADRNIAGTNTPSDHAKHRAWDFMVGNDKATGDAIADYVVNNHDKYGVDQLIWYDRIWSPDRGWRPYGHPGGGRSDTLQHRDHPHVGFRD